MAFPGAAAGPSAVQVTVCEAPAAVPDRCRAGLHALSVRVLLLLFLLASGRSFATDAIRITGSDTMLLLGQRWGEAYMAADSTITVDIVGGGSGAGFAALLRGTADVCFSSRPIQPEERTMLEERTGGPIEEIVCALDGLSVYVHPSNPVRPLSIQDLHDIFTGRKTSWRAFGGADLPITIYGREKYSGSYVIFRDDVLRDAAYAPGMRSLPSTAAVILAVLQDPTGIGYGGVAYGKGVRELAVRRDDGHEAYQPLPATIRSGLYPLRRPLYIYARVGTQDHVRRFIDWVLGPDGQRLVERVGYVPVRAME